MIIKHSRICAGTCGLSYRACLSSRQGQDLKDNGRLMARCLKRCLTGLFSPASMYRVRVDHVGFGTGIQF